MSWSVLVVDDEPMTQNMMRMMLEPVGFDVTAAMDGVEALECVEKSKPDVMILDVMMPKLDGLEVCRILRSNPETAKLPIMMFSGKTDFAAEQEGLKAGANCYRFKPIGRADLIETLQELISQSQLEPKLQ